MELSEKQFDILKFLNLSHRSISTNVKNGFIETITDVWVEYKNIKEYIDDLMNTPLVYYHDTKNNKLYMWWDKEILNYIAYE